MRIGIIGVGKMGSRLGRLWAAKGHQVMYGSRDPEKARTEAANTGFASNPIQGGSYEEAAAFGDVVVIGVPWIRAIETVRSLGTLSGKTVMDITNPVAADMTVAIGHTTSAAEEIARVIPAAHVVKAFNSIHYEVLDNPTFGGLKADGYYCGDDSGAKHDVAQLIADAGFDPVDAGPLQNARLLEPLANLWMQLAFVNKMGTESAFKLLRRESGGHVPLPPSSDRRY